VGGALLLLAWSRRRLEASLPQLLRHCCGVRRGGTALGTPGTPVFFEFTQFAESLR